MKPSSNHSSYDSYSRFAGDANQALTLERLKALLRSCTPQNPQEKEDLQVMLQACELHPDVLSRSCEDGHFTASAWICDREHKRVLLVYHRIFDSWAWTGGHADGDPDLLRVALREAEEETGLREFRVLNTDVLSGGKGDEKPPISLEILKVKAHRRRGLFVPAHLHYNLTWLLEADATTPLRIKEDENSGVAWFLLDEVCAHCSEPQMQPIYAKLNARLRALG